MSVKKSTKEGEPKKNKSSYMFFCSDERSNIKIEKPNLNNKEILTELGLRWKLIKESKSERFQEFEKMAIKDKERYIQEKENFKQNDTDKSVNKEKLKKKNVIEVHNEEEKKTKVNGYINFCKKNREIFKTNNPSLIPKDITKELGIAWKALNEEEKEAYKNI
jgi:hypothetical protein